MDKYDALKIENQLCFPLYACSKEMIKRYKRLLEEIDLTYTQYIAMIALWEKKSLNVKELGSILYLDSGTLSPLLKKLEKKGFVTRKRSLTDERNLIVTITEAGERLKELTSSVPEKMGECLDITSEEVQTMNRLLYKMLGAEYSKEA